MEAKRIRVIIDANLIFKKTVTFFLVCYNFLIYVADLKIDFCSSQDISLPIKMASFDTLRM